MEQPGTHREETPIAARKLGLDRGSISVESPSFRNGQPIPDRHAGGHGRSPALKWSAPPPRTREIVVLCEDPDAPMPEPFVHWIVTGLPADTVELSEGQPPSSKPLASGAVQSRNDVGKDGYYGPEPPRGHGVHRYHFQVLAVDRPLQLRAPIHRDQLVEALRGHVIGWGDLIGTYER
jgi:Raf kinase inhibitor-like YbhB/YbcL family protein